MGGLGLSGSKTLKPSLLVNNAISFDQLRVVLRQRMMNSTFLGM